MNEDQISIDDSLVIDEAEEADMLVAVAELNTE